MSDLSPTSTPIGKHGSPAESNNNPPPSLLDEIREVGAWLDRNPKVLLLLLSITGTLFYFFYIYNPFMMRIHSTITWAMSAWNPEGNQEHGRIVPFIALGLIWYHKDELYQAAGKGSLSGLFWVLAGCLCYIVGIRCLQPRFCLAALPFLLYGGVSFVSGAKAARVILFPCIFLFFMIPVAALEQATFRLQFIITAIMELVGKLVGIGIEAHGTTLHASDGAFDFEIAEGCSGIRSLTAMTMLTAAYVHVTQDRIWKQIVIFCGSVAFAIIGNVGRIFSIILVAKYYDPKFAGGWFHDHSGFVFFPVAVLAMLGFAKLVNLGNQKKSNTGEVAA